MARGARSVMMASTVPLQKWLVSALDLGNLMSLLLSHTCYASAAVGWAIVTAFSL